MASLSVRLLIRLYSMLLSLNRLQQDACPLAPRFKGSRGQVDTPPSPAHSFQLQQRYVTVSHLTVPSCWTSYQTRARAERQEPCSEHGSILPPSTSYPHKMISPIKTFQSNISSHSSRPSARKGSRKSSLAVTAKVLPLLCSLP